MNSNYRNIKFIVGKAGTAKTTTIIDTVTKLTTDYPTKTVAIIAFTHQAVNNIKLKLKERERELMDDCNSERSVLSSESKYFHVHLVNVQKYTESLPIRSYLLYHKDHNNTDHADNEPDELD